MSVTIVLTLLALAASCVPARAQSAVPRACSNEIELLCKGASGAALTACLERNYDNATRACRAQLTAPRADRRDAPWGSEAVARPKAKPTPKSVPARLEEGPGLSQ